MAARQRQANVEHLAPTEPMSMLRDVAAIDGARHNLNQTRVTPQYGRWPGDTLHLLNESLAGELICAWSYKQHHLTAQGLDSPMIAEPAVIEAYSRIITRIGDKDSATRRLLEDILSDVQKHADGLKNGLAPD